jgi:hypothetical protein
MMIQASLEHAVDSCTQGIADESASYLDEAVAYWAGSEELPGPFFFNLAVARCGNFGTCDANGEAPVNVMAWDKFSNLKSSLASESGSECSTSNSSAQEIIASMVIPLIQGTLRYAIFIGLDAVTDDKTKSEGAIFAQAALPYIAACDASAAAVIFDNMKPVAGIQTVDFAAVRSAFESTYTCLGVTGADIGCYENRPETCPTGITASPTEAPAPSPDGGDAPTPPQSGSSATMASWAVAGTTGAIVAAFM